MQTGTPPSAIDYPPSRIRAERTIAAARVAFALASLGAVWISPIQLIPFGQLRYGLHALYVAYSVLLASVTWTRWHGGTRLPLVAHLIDLVTFSLFQYLTLRLSSPSFIIFP